MSIHIIFINIVKTTYSIMSAQVTFKAKLVCANLQETYKDYKECFIKSIHVLRPNELDPLTKHFGTLGSV